jgi:hypothetical protein
LFSAKLIRAGIDSYDVVIGPDSDFTIRSVGIGLGPAKLVSRTPVQMWVESCASLFGRGRPVPAQMWTDRSTDAGGDRREFRRRACKPSEQEAVPLPGGRAGESARHRYVAAPSATAHTALTIATHFVRCVHLLGAQVSGIKILRIFPNILKVWNLTCAAGPFSPDSLPHHMDHMAACPPATSVPAVRRR